MLQTLRAHDSGGQFQTRGRYSAATVRGTTWDTTDRCDGTLTVVLSGTVDVYDFGLHKTISVYAGHRYLAKAPPRLPAVREVSTHAANADGAQGLHVRPFHASASVEKAREEIPRVAT